MPSSFARFSHMSTIALSLALVPIRGGRGGFPRSSADRHRLADLGAVIQFQHRHHGVRVLLLEPRREGQVFLPDLHEFDLDPFSAR